MDPGPDVEFTEALLTTYALNLLFLCVSSLIEAPGVSDVTYLPLCYAKCFAFLCSISLVIITRGG